MSDIENQSGVPKYRQLLTWLTNAIQTGEFQIGSQLPSENALGEKFGISRVTVRNAMQYLETEGLVRREAGRGTFVQAPSLSPEKRTHIAFILIDVSPEKDYNYREIHLMERYLSRQGIPFSWASLTSEDLVLGHFPAVLEKRMCNGLILDGQVTAAHLSLGARFAAKTIVIGNHVLPREVPQVKFNVQKAAYEATIHLARECQRRVLLLVEPLQLAWTREAHSGYVAALNMVEQEDECTYLCPDDLPPATVPRLLANSAASLAILTTEEIYPRVLDVLLAAGVDPLTVPMGVFCSKPLAIAAGHPVWLYLNQPEELHVLATERLLELIQGRRTTVYEEIDLELVPPGTAPEIAPPTP